MPKRRADGLPVSAESDTRPCRHVLVMENIQDPSNMGNVLRTAEALGDRPITRDSGLHLESILVVNPVLRGSMGAVFRLGIRRFETAEDCLKVLHAENITSLAAVPDSDATPITTIPFETGNWAVWIGNEGNGVSEELLEMADVKIRIPMAGRLESLNASVAAGILMYEAQRCKKKINKQHLSEVTIKCKRN